MIRDHLGVDEPAAEDQGSDRRGKQTNDQGVTTVIVNMCHRPPSEG